MPKVVKINGEREQTKSKLERERERDGGTISNWGGGGGSVGKQQNSELRCQDCDDRMDSAPM